MKRQMPQIGTRKAPAGFTLVELMIVVAIIVLLAGFLTPSVSKFMRRSQGKAAAGEVAKTLRMARNQAMSRGEAVLAEINDHTNGDNGNIVLFRTRNNNLARCAPDAENFDPHDTDCYAMSCTQAGGFARDEVARLDLGQKAPDMILSGIDASGADGGSLRLCFSPNGRVLSMSGTPLSSACDAINTRIFVREGAAGDGDVNDNPLGGPALDTCLDVDEHSETQRQAQKDGRDISNFYSIQVPYNGAISVIQ